MKNKSKESSLCVFSLKTMAAMLEIPGGAQAMEMLLLAAGFLTGAYRSSNAHLPYQRYLDRDYFLVIDREFPEKYRAYTFCITSKGLDPVLRRLKAFGIKLLVSNDF